MPNKALIDSFGLIGGIMLAICTIPQLYHMIATKSAGDVSLLYTVLYFFGVLLSTIYMILIEAWAGAVPLILETLLGSLLVALKVYLDRNSTLKPKAIEKIKPDNTVIDIPSIMSMPSKLSLRDKLQELKSMSLHPDLERLAIQLHINQSHLLGYQESRPNNDFLATFLNMHTNNAGDPFVPGDYKIETKQTEMRVLNHFARLWDIPASQWWGYILSMGSTEGIIFALLSAREYLSGKRLHGEHPLVAPYRKDTLPPVCFFSQDVHYSTPKACAMLCIKSFGEAGMEWYPDEAPEKEWIDRIPSNQDGTINVEKLLLYVEFFAAKGHPIICVLTVGTTFTGAMDDIDSCSYGIYEICSRYGLDNRKMVNEDNKISIRKGFWLHIDGALAAGYLPFLRKVPGYEGKVPNFTFKNKHVCSISLSAHKWMGSPFPSGIIMLRKYLQVAPSGYTPEYVGSPDTTLAGSRNGLAPLVFAQHILTVTNDQEIAKITEVMETIQWFKNELISLGEKLGLDLWVQNAPLSLSVLLRLPSKDICNKYSISSQSMKGIDEYGNECMVKVAHIYIMRFTTKRILSEFLAECENGGEYSFAIQVGKLINNDQ